MTTTIQSEMETEHTHMVTRLLHQVKDGSEEAKNELVAHVYAQLRQIAQRRMKQERADHTLQPTELVHEAYIRMTGGLDKQGFENRAHFYGAAALAMRRVLINYARSRNTAKRGNGQPALLVNVIDIAEDQNPEQILAIDDAIQQLEASDPKLGELVRLRFFAGLSVDETAEALDISRRTVIRQWNFARAFLGRALKKMQEE